VRDACLTICDVNILTCLIDSHIYIWRTTGHFIESLEAHAPGCVNAVAWHPTDPCMFASAGDDKRVKM
jgi:WD40 repeat protein